MKCKGTIATAIATGMLSAGCAMGALKTGPGNTPFWIAVDNPQQIDVQVARFVADHAALVALRGTDANGAVSDGILKDVHLLKQQMPQTPVLLYARASRTMGGKGFLAWVNQDARMQFRQRSGKNNQRFGDVTLPGYQNRIASSIATEVARGAFDGVALDFAVRTPRYQPAPIAKMCKTDSALCDRYAKGMDSTFAAIRDALGNRPVIYNGLWNFGPGSVSDQQQLLDHSDAAAVEFFGGDPKAPQQSFNHDILPFLQAMAQTPEDKKILVYGRGSWGYMNYAEDYNWQRYLYCAYLLAAGKNTFFKYHATFQASVPAGRSGGLSVYSDWSVNLGAPSKAYGSASGLYSRPFAHGLVIVAPDDGNGGSYDLPHAMYSPEGEKYEGRVTLKAKEALLLLDNKVASQDGSDAHLLDMKLLSDWPKATLSGDTASPVLSMSEGGPSGSHDMLLDAVRTMHPRNSLRLALQAAAEGGTSVQIVAEIDDPSHQYNYAIVNLNASSGSRELNGTQAISFRSDVSRNVNGGALEIPVVAGPKLSTGAWQTISLDGHALFANSKYAFRRWDFVRFNGAMKLKSVALSN